MLHVDTVYRWVVGKTRRGKWVGSGAIVRTDEMNEAVNNVGYELRLVVLNRSYFPAFRLVDKRDVVFGEKCRNEIFNESQESEIVVVVEKETAFREVAG